MEEKKYLLVWSDSGLTTKSRKVNAPYHFIHFGEVATYLNKKIDGKLECLDIEACQNEFQEIMDYFIKNEFNAVAFYLNTDNLQNSLSLLGYLKQLQPECKTIAYGEMPLYLPKFFKKTDFDAIVDRECDQETALLDFFNYSIGKCKEEDLHGIHLIKNNQLVPTNPGIYLDSSEWEFSDENIVPVNKYFEMENKNQYVCTISRGCPFNCPYCNAVLYYGKHERRRKIDDLINFINTHDYDRYKFFAPNFTLNEKEAYELCKALILNEKKISWSCTTRPDLLKNEELIEAMAKAGCIQVAIGIESVSQEDLDNINKRYNREYILTGIENLKKYGITYKALIMFGVPNQTKESIEYTLDFLYDHDLVVRPTAYTPFYEMNHNMNAEQLSKYDKRTYYEGIPGLEYGDFLRLIYNTEEYKKILRKGE